MVVETTGGVRRRPGMAYVAPAAGRGRLVDLEIGPGLAYLLAFSDFQVDVYRDGVLRATVLTPWDRAAARADRLGPARAQPSGHPSGHVRRSNSSARAIRSGRSPNGNSSSSARLPSRTEPFARFAAADVAMQSTATTGTVTLNTSAAVFVAEHLGGIVRMKGKQIQLTNIQTSTQAVGLVLQTLDDTGPTTDWDELAFSDARGWPVAVSFHQDRMVIGGSRDLPNSLWLSKTGDHFNFDVGDGLDDEAIAFRLVDNDTPAIRGLMSGRQLQVFASTSEWVVTGTPLTPTNIQVQRQSRIGSPRDRQVPPRDVDGATLFVARSGHEVREFLFVDTEQAYQAADVALLAQHLVRNPVDQAFDHRRRLFLIVNEDGSLATIAIYRNADIAAWSLQETAGQRALGRGRR